MNRILLKPANSHINNHLTRVPHHQAGSLRFHVIPRTSLSSSLPTYRMSSISTTKNEYLVIVPDYANSLQKRLDVRSKHFEGLKPHVESGDVVFGGAMLSKHGAQGETPDMTGSAMLIKAESEEATREWLANDVYAKSGVWNLNEVKIYPFRCAVRTAM